ncbi:MAG: aminoacyl-tRNA hydrolase [Oscillospiraceae bacterium]|jgi:PTH1 family peptidyl-tRNA hydrolase|nr:aminoacyl-tRNA hydrolase [Oscillospiraceae bacterium]
MVEFIIAGLGNPGERYDQTRHNAGFWTVDELASRRGIKVKKLKFHGVYATDGNLLLLKPQTFMNLSGQSVRDACAFYKIPPERLIVIYDDVSLPPGKIRLRPTGSDGGHNGIKDILYHIQTDSFPRVKIGVGPPPPEVPLADWVTGILPQPDRKPILDAVPRAADAAEWILRHGIEAAMNRFNGDNAI